MLRAWISLILLELIAPVAPVRGGSFSRDHQPQIGGAAPSPLPDGKTPR